MAVQVIREVCADVVKRGSTRAVYAKQHDLNSRFLNVRIQEEGRDIVVEPNLTVILNVERPDKAENMFYGEVNEDGTVKVPMTAWMLDLEGTLVCDISIVSEDPTVAKLTTMQFNIYVEAAVITDESIVDTEEYSVIVDLLTKANTAIDKAETVISNLPKIQNGTWWLYDSVSETYIDTGVSAIGKQGESGLPDRVVYTDINYFRNIFNNTHCEFVFSDTYEGGTCHMILFPFKDNTVLNQPYEETATDADTTKASSITVSIECVEGLSIVIWAQARTDPMYQYNATVLWSGAEPTFTPGYTYFLSFVPLSDTRILGAWSEVPTV